QRPLVRTMGRSLVKAMPHFLTALSYIGTAAMLWVGAEILAHGIPPLHHALEQAALPWAAKATLCALGGAIVGACIAVLLRLYTRITQKIAT
ncbi:MAG: DUF808 family protein, partial [Rickettsiales bacterium]|nr:DUF808 family protein [Rickettsiales bacterium]